MYYIASLYKARAAIQSGKSSGKCRWAQDKLANHPLWWGTEGGRRILARPLSADCELERLWHNGGQERTDYLAKMDPVNIRDGQRVSERCRSQEPADPPLSVRSISPGAACNDVEKIPRLKADVGRLSASIFRLQLRNSTWLDEP